MRKNNKGFTLIEIIAVIIIIGILILIAVPAVTEYVNNSKDDTYESYTSDMNSAAKNMMIDCIANDNNSCVIPDKNQSTIVYLSELIDKGYSDLLTDPQGDGNCNETRSYVKITNNGKTETDFSYETCLYCSKYETKSESCSKTATDGDMPICGEIDGESTLWTNKDRTISIKCNDISSGCSKDTFSRTFTTTTKESMIGVADKSGNTTNCPVNVYVDKDLPKCQLKIKSGIASTGGWYGGNVKVEMEGMDDGTGSGILTYGIGTSIKNRNYNKETVYTLDNGITTVIGYVKDYAGNEGICSMEVKVDLTPPTQEIARGYQIYPSKESYTVTNMTESGTTFTTTTTNPLMSFTGLDDYKKASKVVVHLTNAITEADYWQVFYSTTSSHSGTNSVKTLSKVGSKVIEFNIPQGNYPYIRVDFGETAEKAYTISRIDLVVNDISSLYTNKNVTIYAEGKDTVSGVAKYSFDDGLTWTANSYYRFATNSTVKVKSMDTAGNVSIASTIVINNIDKLAPSCALAKTGTLGNNDWYTSNVTFNLQNINDQDSTTDYAKSNIRDYGINSVSGTTTTVESTDTTAKTYTGYVEDNAGNVTTCATTIKRDATKPTCSLTNSGVILGSTMTWSTKTDASSGIGSYGLTNSTTATYNSSTSYTLSTPGSITIYGYVKDNAGNTGSCSKTVTIQSVDYNFVYTGAPQTFTAPYTGIYEFVLCGARGAGGNSTSPGGSGKGGYTKGQLALTAGEKLYVYVGEYLLSRTYTRSWNGGSYGYYGGGGATDIRVTNGTWDNTASLRSRIMVAAGGGGNAESNFGGGGHGGGLTGNAGSNSGDDNSPSKGGTQTGGGGFGKGWDGSTSIGWYGGGGGGGYYGGTGGAESERSPGYAGGGGGGSSFISGYSGCNAVNASGTHTGKANHYSGKVFTNMTMTAGACNDSYAKIKLVG